ncbi:MAG: M12 family metallo-peptidase, partial [Acidobacteriota bacterium]|nr:M12 family metallo-peptidase [Acidobacteriota bacterium]
MKRLVFLLLFIFSINVVVAFGQKNQALPDKLWREVDDLVLQQRLPQRVVIPNAYRTFMLDKTALQGLLRKVPMEFTEVARGNSSIITLPMPNGKLARFSVEESPILEPQLAAKFPEIKTYRGRGIDDPAATARFDLTPAGFHSMIISNAGTIYIDPYAVGDTRNYISYLKTDVERTGEFSCDVKNGADELPSYINFLPDSPTVISGTNLRTYRLAVAATAEYTNVFRQADDTDAQARARALSQIVLIINRVNGVYERDVAIRMVLIANQDLIIYTDPATDPYSNGNGSSMLGQNQSNLNTVIGADNYDIGHVFSTGGGGIAQLRSPCGSGKARGVTGLPNPVGDPFAIDYVAHEMGHQFGGNHTFNVSSGSCGGQRVSSAAYEPGSGVTIMGYAGICGSQNLAGNSIDTFHVKSIEEIVTFTTAGFGSGCGVSTPTENTPPSVTAQTTGLVIPKQTPFYLTAAATDPDNDSLTYDWQEYDLGAGATTVPNSDSDGVERPIFRPYLPNTSPTRTFPSLQFILNNANAPPNTTNGRLTGETLPNITRTMIFQVIVRDNRVGGGGVNTAPAVVNVDATSGPFVITAPETSVSWAVNSSQTVTWDVANTTNANINAANVKISLSTDGGNTFPIILSASTPNDGTETITVPNVNTSQARIKVEAVNNIFFDISGADFTISTSTAPNRTLFDFDGDGKADVSVFRPSNGGWYINQSMNGFAGIGFGQAGD